MPFAEVRIKPVGTAIGFFPRPIANWKKKSFRTIYVLAFIQQTMDSVKTKQNKTENPIPLKA